MGWRTDGVAIAAVVLFFHLCSCSQPSTGNDASGADADAQRDSDPDTDRGFPDSDVTETDADEPDSDVHTTPIGCDLDGDGYENDGPGCGGDDCDDLHPSCWDQVNHGCCGGEGLIFHSEFEGGVEIDHTSPAPASQWRLPILGTDTMTGHDWTHGFPEALDRLHVNIQTLVGGGSELVGNDPARIDDPEGALYGTTGFVDAQIIEHPSIDSRPDNRVLFFHAWRDDAMTANSRLQASWFPPSRLAEQGSETFVAYWLKLQPDLYRVHTAFALEGDWRSRWRNLGEWWNGQSGCGQGEMRIGLYLETYDSEFVFWKISSRDLWSEDTSDRPDLAPREDGWFFVEIYVRRHPRSGRVWVGIDGMTLFDVEEVQTMPDSSCWDGALCYHFLKMYGDLYNYRERLDGVRPPYQLWQYYDGLRIYDGLPRGHCAIDGSCPDAADLAL